MKTQKARSGENGIFGKTKERGIGALVISRKKIKNWEPRLRDCQALALAHKKTFREKRKKNSRERICRKEKEKKEENNKAL